MSHDVVTVVLALLIGLGTGALGPAVLRRLPEPELDTPPENGEEESESLLTIRPIYEKVSYAALAEGRYLRVGLGLAAALAAGLLGARIEVTGDLVVALVAVPTGTWLGYVDLRTTFLPTVLIYPTLLAVLVAGVLVAVIADQGTDLRRALVGCVLYGGIFYALWWIIPGYGFGDVRLAFLLGSLLGFLGWYELVTGFMLAQLLGGIGGAILALLRLIDPRRNPFGPYMLGAALAGAAFGPSIAGALGY